MRIWFNHWFSTAYHFIDMMKEHNHYVIASNERETSVYQTNADEFYLEPKYDKDTYLDYCVNFCKEHNIEVFFPKRGMDIIVKNLDRFGDVKVICETDYEKYTLLQDKVKTAKWFEQNNICKIPEMHLCTNVYEFKYWYNIMIQKYERVCIKYNQDEGGMSYKLISTSKPSIAKISDAVYDYSYDYICDCLKTVESFKPLIIMPYLSGHEVSVDCLAVENGLVAVPRFKLSNRVTKLSMQEDLIQIAENFQKEMNLVGAYNIQFRYHKDEMYLLEVNTRLSGGSWKAKFMGIEFPVLCCDKFTGKKVEKPVPIKKEMNISNIESAIIL